MSSSYRIRKDGKVTPVYMYSIDVTENVVNKVGAAREQMAFVLNGYQRPRLCSKL